MSKVWTATVVEDSTCKIYQRVVGPDFSDSDADLVTSSDVSSVLIKVWKKSDGTQVGVNQEPTAATVFPAGTVTINSVVYNFVWVVPTALLPEGDQVYRIEIAITPASGQAYKLDPVELTTINMIGS